MGNQEESKKGKMSKSRGPRDCRYYGKLGHKKKDYWIQKNNEGDKLEGNKEENVVTNPKRMVCFFL